MTPVQPPRDQLLVTIQGRTAFVHVRGRGSYKGGTSLKRFGLEAIAAECHDIVFDLSECLGMDSTFMGVLAGLAFRLKASGLGGINLVNLNAHHQELLDTIGLDRVFTMYRKGETPAEYKELLGSWNELEALPHAPESRRTTAETMLEAHEHLVQASPDNHPLFKDVIAYLRDDVDHADLEGDATL